MEIFRITTISLFPLPKMSLPYLFSLLLLSSTSLQAQSLLWKITGNGLKEPSWIYGTMHVRDSRVFKLPEGWDDKLRESKRLILELNPSEKPDPMKMMALIAAPEDSTLERILKPEDRKLMEEWVNDSLQLPWQMVQGLKPFFLMAMIQEYKMPKDMPEALDLWLAHRAKDWSVPVYGLESIDEQMAAINTLSIAQQSELLLEMIRPGDSDANNQEEELMQAYLGGRLDQLASFAKNWETDPMFKKEILEFRNYKMSERIGMTLEEDGSAFIAVGALHLPGEDGILQLLRNKGFEVVPM